MTFGERDGGPLTKLGAERLRERDGELEHADALLAAARSGSGGLLVFEGAAGIGKTSLIRAVAGEAVRHQMAVLSAHGSELERGFAYGVVHQLIDPLVLQADGVERAKLFGGAAAFAAPLFEGSDAAMASADGHATMHGLFWLVADLALRGAVVLLVDDAQWCDEASARFVAFLAARLEGLPIVVVLATRPAGVDATGPIAGLMIDPGAVVLRPGPLSLAATADVLGDCFGQRPDPAFTQACRAASGGNPLMLQELARSARQAHPVPDAASAIEIERLGSDAITHRVLRSLQPLGPDATALAHAVSVLGDEAQLIHAAQLADLDPAAASRAADALADAGVLEPGRPLRFLHPMLGTAVRAALPAGAKSIAHARAATLLTAAGASRERVAAHLLIADPAGDPARVRLLRDVAGDATARGAHEAAVAYLRRALAEHTAIGEYPDLLHALGRAERHAREPGAVATLDAAHRAAADPVARARVSLDLAFALVPGQAERAVSLLAAARDAVSLIDSDLTDRLEAERLLVTVAAPALGRPVSARARAVTQRPACASLSESERLMLVALARDRNAHALSAADAEALIQRALPGPLFDGLTAGIGLLTAMIVLRDVDRDDLARPLVDAALADAQQRGSAPRFAIASVWRAIVSLGCGDLAGAEADGRAALDVTREYEWQRSPALAVVIDALAGRDAGAEADALLDEYAVNGPLPGDRFMTPLLAARGRLHYSQGRLDRAREDLEDAERRLGGPENERADNLAIRVTLVRVLLALGEHEQAERRSAASLRAGRAHRTPRSEGLGLLAAGLVAPRGEDIALLEQACAKLAASPARLDQARGLVDLGAALRRANRRADARAPLRAALDRADRCGAAALAKVAREELVATGARPRRRALRGADALTPSEARVCRLAAEGLTNREIAQALFVTMRTVEGHLTHAYMKLDITARGELGEALLMPGR
jgi:DNA-binding CsgD family transcriptional regulator